MVIDRCQIEKKNGKAMRMIVVFRRSPFLPSIHPNAIILISIILIPSIV